MRYNEKIQLKLYEYNGTQFALQAIIDDYQEVSFEHNLYEAGTFTITINYNIPNATKFRKGLFIQFGDSPYDFGEIQRVQDSLGSNGKGSQTRTITGYDSRYILKRRVIKNLNDGDGWAMTSKGEICMRSLIADRAGLMLRLRDSSRLLTQSLLMRTQSARNTLSKNKVRIFMKFAKL